MILKVFKEKSNQKYINKLLNARQVAVSNTKMNTVGVILNSKEFSDFEAIKSFFKTIGIQERKIKIITFVEDPKDSNDLWGSYFNPKNFGWKGKINHSGLQEFIDTEFDLLISFYESNCLELNQVVAMSKANFKVGLTNEDQRLYDLMIHVKLSDFKTLTKELKKYLTVLNKL
nr:hypothetical protein [uncultured Psychroserpens sp.]